MPDESRALTTRPVNPQGDVLARQILVACLLAQIPLNLATKMTLQRIFLYGSFLLPAVGVFLLISFRGRLSIPRKLSWILLGTYVAMLFVGALLGDPKASAPVLATKYSCIASFVLGWCAVREAAHIRTIVRTILAVCAVSALYSIWQQTIGFPDFELLWAISLGQVHGVDIFIGDARRATGFTIYSASNSLILTQAFLLLVGLPAPQGRLNAWRAAWIVLFGLALLFSQTRGIWLGAVAGLVTILVLGRLRDGKSRAGIIPAFLVMAILIAIAYMVNPVIRTRIESFQGAFTNPNHPFLFRVLSMWVPTLHLYPPRLVGYGPGALLVADNMFLQTLVSAGIIGLMALLALHAWGARLSYRRASLLWASHPWRARFQLVFVGIVVSQLVCYITGDYLLSSPGNIFFWTLAGMALSPARECSERSAQVSSRDP